MVRRVTVHQSRTVDNELLPVITIYETGINKEKVKNINKYTKRHYVLIRNREKYEVK